MPVQVAHVVPLAARIGGYERQALLLASNQAQNGTAASIITHAAHAHQLRDRTGGAIVHPVNWSLGRASVRAIDRAIAAATVLHVHAIDPFSAAVVIRARRRGLPAIIKIATQGDASRYADPLANPPEVEARRLFEPWRLARQQRQMRDAWTVIRECEQFIALSHAIEGELKHVGIDADRIMRLPNAVEVPDECVEIRRQARRAVYLGRLEERKRVGDLLTALEIVRATRPDAELHIVGEGASRAELESRSTAAVFHGGISDPDVLLASADVFIFPSEREGCPNALLEAAAAGLPCIATSIPGIVDWFDESTTVLVPPARPGLIADAWLNLWDDAARRTALSATARQRVQSIASVKTILIQYNNLYRTLTRRLHK